MYVVCIVWLTVPDYAYKDECFNVVTNKKDPLSLGSCSEPGIHPGYLSANGAHQSKITSGYGVVQGTLLRLSASFFLCDWAILSCLVCGTCTKRVHPPTNMRPPHLPNSTHKHAWSTHLKKTQTFDNRANHGSWTHNHPEHCQCYSATNNKFVLVAVNIFHLLNK